MQPITVSLEETEQPIRISEIFRVINERTLIGRNPAGIFKREDTEI